MRSPHWLDNFIHRAAAAAAEGVAALMKMRATPGGVDAPGYQRAQ